LELISYKIFFSTDPDIDVIPPLTLTALLEADKDQSGTTDAEDAIPNDSAVFYGLNQAHLLTEHLSKKHLPGLSSQEQMYLLALSDTIATSRDVDIEGIESNDNRKYRTEISGQENSFTRFMLCAMNENCI